MIARAYTTQVPLSTEVRDIFGGTEIESAPGPGRFRIYGRHAAAAGTVVLSARLGSDVRADKLPMNVAAGAPIKPDDHIIDIDSAPGERLIVTLEETAGTATIPNVRVEFEEFSRQELMQMAAGQRV